MARTHQKLRLYLYMFSTLPSDCLFLFDLLLILGEEKILLALQHKHSLVPRPRLAFHRFQYYKQQKAGQGWERDIFHHIIRAFIYKPSAPTMQMQVQVSTSSSSMWSDKNKFSTGKSPS